MRVQVVVLAALLSAAGSGWSAPAPTAATNVVRPVVLADKSLLDSFIVERGFQLELAAAQPMVSAPVAMAFDENGRLFVVEMRDFPDRRSVQPHLGRVRVLDDPNAEGVYQTSTIFADDLPFPSAIACYGGGVFVAAAPDIYYFKATHNGGADMKQVVLTGLGGEATPTAQRLPNNFNWGLDDRIHGTTAGLGGVLTAPGWGGGRVALSECDFSFDPRTLAVTREAGPAQSGLTFDDFGREFVSDDTRPLLQMAYELSYAERNPFYPAPPPLRNVASPATEIFRFSAVDQPAPRPSVATRSPRPAPLNGLVPTWLAQARGCVIYRGSAYPTNYLGNAFIADPTNHVIHRAILSQNGLGYFAARAPNETNTEFLVSRDDSFRPAQIVNSPDGVLYVADMQDGNERGRIFRIVPANFKAAPRPQMARAKTQELAAALAHPNGWHRDTAARLLFEQQDPGAVPLLAQMVDRARSPATRVRALWALARAGAYRETNALRALRDPDPPVRETGLRLLDQLAVKGAVSGETWDQLRALANDPNIRVRCQLAFTLGSFRGPDKLAVLAQVLLKDAQNPYIQNAVMSSLADSGANMLTHLAGTPAFRRAPGGLQFLRQLAFMIGLQGRMPDVTGTMHYLVNTAALDWAQKLALFAELGEGLHRTRSSFGLVDPQGAFQGVYSAAFGIAQGQNGAEALRVDAIRVVGGSYGFSQTGDWLLLQSAPQPFRSVQYAALATLGRYNDPRVLATFIANWPALTPALRQQAVSALLSRADRVGAVLAAVERGQIPAADVGPVDRNILRTYSDPAVSHRALALFGPVPQQRPQVLQRFSGALRLSGSITHGRQLYLQRCAACHQPDAAGSSLGPSLLVARTRGREKVLEAILQPNASVPPEYAATVVESRDSELLVGIKTQENAATLTLRQVSGPAVWPLLNVQSSQLQTWSLMPDGLEEGLSLQDMADLIDWLMQF